LSRERQRDYQPAPPLAVRCVYWSGQRLGWLRSQGQLVTEKTKTLDATAPVDYTYGSANPFKERTVEWQDLFGGFGQSEAPQSIPRRYDHAEYVDASIDGLWMLGRGSKITSKSMDDEPSSPVRCGSLSRLCTGVC
jgi:hypothetical protein